MPVYAAGLHTSALGVALDAAAGVPMLGVLPAQPARPVLYLALEDSDRRLKARAATLGYPQLPHTAGAPGGHHDGARAATDRERDRVVYLIHRLRCEYRLSIREVRRHLEEYGIRHSVGTIMRDLQNFECPRCPHILSG